MATEDEERAAMMADLVAYSERVGEVADLLVKQNPGLNHVTAHIVAGDVISGERATEAVKRGADAEKVYVTVGSYARWDWVIAMLSAGEISEAWFDRNIADLWRGSDPDDTSPVNLSVWQTARRKHGAYVRDGRPLPKGKDGLITVYRGGPPTEAIFRGFAWTTDPKIARKFANGAGERIPRKNGVVISGRVLPSQVLAFLTRRGESEVIIDPRLVRGVKVVGERGRA